MMSKRPLQKDTNLLLPKLEDSGDGVRSEAMCESLLPADLVGLHLRL